MSRSGMPRTQGFDCSRAAEGQPRLGGSPPRPQPYSQVWHGVTIAVRPAGDMPRTQRFIRITATVALLLATLDRSLAAQSLRGAVRDSAGHQPIAGAVVMLLDSSGTVLGRNISDERGQYRIALTSTARSARVVRIGFQPRAIPLPSPADRTAPFDVSMVPVSTMLTAVLVQERSD